MQYREQVAGNSRFRLPSCSLYPIICNLQPAIGPRRRSSGNLPRFANGAAPEAEPIDNAVGCVEGTAILGLPEIDVTDPERQDLQRRILRIEAFTLAWMSVEAAVSLAPPGQRAARLCLPSAATARSSCCLQLGLLALPRLVPESSKGKAGCPPCRRIVVRPGRVCGCRFRSGAAGSSRSSPQPCRNGPLVGCCDRDALAGPPKAATLARHFQRRVES